MVGPDERSSFEAGALDKSASAGRQEGNQRELDLQTPPDTEVVGQCRVDDLSREALKRDRASVFDARQGLKQATPIHRASAKIAPMALADVHIAVKTCTGTSQTSCRISYSAEHEDVGAGSVCNLMETQTRESQNTFYIEHPVRECPFQEALSNFVMHKQNRYALMLPILLIWKRLSLHHLPCTA